MNKRQRKKLYKKMEKELSERCLECGDKLNMVHRYHRIYRTCNPQCYADMIGVNLYE